MYGLKELLKKEETRLVQILKDTESRLQNAPDGSLRITSSRRKVQYMHCTNEDKQSRHQGTYIKKNDLPLARALAQKEYDLKLQKFVKRRLDQVSSLILEYENNKEIEDIYRVQRPQRQELILPAEKTWEQRVAEWKAIPYEKKGFRQDDPEIYTKLQERVRSKSEKILADTFCDCGIVYKYECPLTLKGVVIYPDFTFLNQHTGEEIYWEHDGKMGDMEYAEKAVRKINTYIQNGILPGKQLILTFETTRNVLNDTVVKNLIKEYLE